jgi:hypothetical protein
MLSFYREEFPDFLNMTPESIHAFLEKEKTTTLVKIELKKRNLLKGMFVRLNDYDDLRVKNFWRIVPEANIESWNKKPDNNLLRIYNGSEFTRLTSVTVAAAKSVA